MGDGFFPRSFFFSPACGNLNPKINPDLAN